MPANSDKELHSDEIYFHIFREVEKGEIFSNEQDYQTFLGFLKDYLTLPTTYENKKTFTIRGRTFRGLPHQPQNYFGQVELLAYKLEPNRFDLLIKQITPGSIEKLIRSLSTRYAVYFNRCHHRKGILFKDIYKSIEIKSLSSLLYLTRDFHSGPTNNKDNNIDHNYSSYPEYLGQRETPWIKSQVILSLEGVNDYKSFVEDSMPKPTTKAPSSSPKTQVRIPEIIVATVIFLLFSVYGLNNIQARSQSIAQAPPPSPVSLVLGTVEEVTNNKEGKPEGLIDPEEEAFVLSLVEPEETIQPQEVKQEEDYVSESVEPEKIMMIIQTSDGQGNVNIRQNPTITSAIIGKANEGDTFEFVSVDAEWYGIKLTDGSVGYISSQYLTIKEEKNY